MNKLMVIILAFSFALSSNASTCRNKLQEKSEMRKAIAGTSGLIVGGTTLLLTAGVATLGTSFLTLPVVAAGVGGYWLISGRKPSRLVTLISQANSCNGKLINKAYRAYLKTNDELRLTKHEFCGEILRHDADGSLCVGNVPTIKQVGKYYVD